MKARLFTVILLAALVRVAAADSTNAPAKIGATEAGAHYDQLMTVTGVVAQVTLRPSIVFINLDHPYPDSPFAAVIHSQDTNQFSNLKSLMGRSVEITGHVQNYHDRPEIVIKKADQIYVIGGWTNTPSAAVVPAAAPEPAAPKSAKGANDLTNGVM